MTEDSQRPDSQENGEQDKETSHSAAPDSGPDSGPNSGPAGLRITLDDLQQLDAAEARQRAALLAGAETGDTALVSADASGKRYGNIRDTVQESDDVSQPASSLLLKSWFYLGVAGLLGALAGWAVVEPFFEDSRGGGESSWFGELMIPMVVAFCCLGCAIAESVVERSWRKAFARGGLAFGLGIALGFLFTVLANIAYNLLLAIASMGGEITPEMPSWWAARSLAWALFGVSAGLVYGVAGLSVRKMFYGILGGMLGAAVGGALFDPIGNLMQSGDLSRSVGFGVFGLSTGVAIGLVESALKQRWLYVQAGPLAGKQFILYRPRTTVGRNQGADIYLFKDPAIEPLHATLELRGPGIWLLPHGPVFMTSNRIRPRLLRHRDRFQIGRYHFLYQERRHR